MAHPLLTVVVLLIICSGYVCEGALRVDSSHRFRQQRASLEAASQTTETSTAVATTNDKAVTEEPVTVTVIVVGILTGLAATAIYEGVKWAFTSNDVEGTITRHGPHSLTTIAGDSEADYATSLFPYCKSQDLSFSSGARRHRQWKVFDNKIIGRDCELTLNWHIDTTKGKYIDCRDKADMATKGYKGSHPDSAYRKYYHEFTPIFSKSNGNPVNTHAYIMLGMSVSREAFQTAQTKQTFANEPRIHGYVEVWEEGHCSNAEDKGGTIWRFFYELHEGNVKYFGNRNDWAAPYYAVDSSGARISTKQYGAGMSNRIL